MAVKDGAAERYIEIALLIIGIAKQIREEVRIDLMLIWYKCPGVGKCDGVGFAGWAEHGGNTEQVQTAV